MEENLHHDPLEDLFKKALDNMDESAAEDGWDLPSEQPWQKIKVNLHPGKRRRVGIFWIGGLAAALLFLLAFGFFYLGTSSVESTPAAQEATESTTAADDERVTSLSPTSTATDSSPATANIENNLAPTVPTEERKAQNAILSNSAIVNNEAAQTNTKEQETAQLPQTTTNAITETNAAMLNEIAQSSTNTSTSDLPPTTNFPKTPSTATSNSSESDVAQLASKNDSPREEIPSVVSPATPANETTPNALPSAVDQSFSPVDPLSPLRIASLVSLAVPAVRLPAIDIPIELPAKPARFYLAAFVAPRTERFSIETSTLKGKALKENFKDRQQVQSNWTAALHLGYQFNRHWSVESGLQLGFHRATTKYPLTLRHDPTNEQPNSNGELENAYNYTLRTSYGDLETDIVLTRDDAPLSSQTPLAIEIETESSYQSLRLPLLVRYQRRVKKFHFFARTGLLTNFTLASNLSIAKTDTKAQNLKKGKTKVKPGNKKPKSNTTFDYQIALGVEYELSSQLRLSLSPAFTQRLTPIRFKNSSKAYPQFVSWQVGTSYYF